MSILSSFCAGPHKLVLGYRAANLEKRSALCKHPVLRLLMRVAEVPPAAACRAMVSMGVAAGILQFFPPTLNV